MARVLLHSRHCILTDPRMRRSSTSDSCADYAWPRSLRLRARQMLAQIRPEITESIRDLGRRIDHVFHPNRD